jgi:serine/threonine protein kinase
LDSDIKIGEDCENLSDQPQEDEVILGDQKLDHVLGFGKSGSVICKGINIKSHQEVAIKIISKKDLCSQTNESIRDMISILKQSQHHNVVRLEDYFESKDYFHICYELHSRVTLFEYINVFGN